MAPQVDNGGFYIKIKQYNSKGNIFLVTVKVFIILVYALKS